MGERKETSLYARLNPVLAFRRLGNSIGFFLKQALYVLLSPYRLFKAICFAIGFLVIAVGTYLAFFSYTFVASIPDLERMSFQQVQAKAEQCVKRSLSNKKAQVNWTPLRSMNRDLIYAIVMSEDSTYFEHSGLNFDAILNALAVNLKKRKYAYGASTITQQVAKNVFLSKEKTLERKFREFFITLELERHFTKNEILELYLNVAAFGPEIYGITAASWYYFKKPPSKINAAEGAFMALMLPAPQKNHHTLFVNRNLTATKKRRIRRILRDMLYQEMITQEQYDDYSHYDFYSTTGK